MWWQGRSLLTFAIRIIVRLEHTGFVALSHFLDEVQEARSAIDIETR